MMNLSKHFGALLLPLMLCINYTQAQVVTIMPAIATADDSITVTYDATLGNGALANATVVYAHAGLITSKSTSGSDWKYVQGNWGTDDAKVKMTSIGNHKFTLRYHIRSFYGLPNNELATKLAFVFRNLDGSTVGRTANGGDIYVDLSQGGYSVLFTAPSTPQVLKTTDSLTVIAHASELSDLVLYIDGDSVLATTDSILNTKLAAADLGLGKHQLIVKGHYNTETASDTTYVVVRPGGPNVGNIPNNCVDGINYINDTTVTLVLFAPNKSFVYVLGDFNNWEFDNTYFMNRNPQANRFWITLTGLEAGKEYAFQYVIDDQQLRVADIYASKLLDPWNDGYIPSITYPNLKPYPAGKTSEVVSVLQTAQPAFNWLYSDTFQRPATDKMVIYELLIRDFIGRHDYQTIKDTLSYLKRLGVNTIEFMPLTEFEGNESWGYNVSFYFAPDKYYGTREALKQLVDECHKQGFAVVLDMVLNHSFGQSPMVRMYFDPNAGQYGQPTAQNPWFNQTDKHPYGVGYDFNHESTATQFFVDTVIKYWLSEYKMDGFRFDLSKGFTQKYTGTDVNAWGAYDQTRINIWKRIMGKVRVYDSSAYMILEHFADNSEEKVLSAEGFMLWGNLNHSFNEATMGYTGTSDLNWADYKNRGWADPHVVAYAESHDEERLMFKNITYGSVTNPSYKIKDTTIALQRIEAAMCMLIPLRGPKMLWQFEELGYDYSIDYNGRIGNKPIRWDYARDSRRKRIYEVVSTLSNLKTTDDSLSTNNYSYVAGATAIKTLVINSGTTKASIIANFGVTAIPVVIQFPQSGLWYDVFGKDSVVVSGTSLNDTLAPGQYKVFVNKPVETNYPTAINETNTDWSGATVFPNPTDDLFSVYTGLPNTQSLALDIYNVTGTQVYSKAYPKCPEAINLQASQLGLTKGLYFVTLRTSQSSKQFKLLIL